MFSLSHFAPLFYCNGISFLYWAKLANARYFHVDSSDLLLSIMLYSRKCAPFQCVCIYDLAQVLLMRHTEKNGL